MLHRSVAAALLMLLGTGAAPITQPVGPPASASAPTGRAATPSAHALTATDLDAFFSAFLPYAMQRDDIPGGVVIVVHDGHVVFAHGYGYANIANRTPVTADRTLFRIGSISKLFTWTAVMQLVQAGKLNLDRDINDYLDFRIPEKYGKPITMRDLMTHTPGFEETVSGLWVNTPQQLLPLGVYLRRHIPGEIFPPGTTVAYSNYGATLAGYIVQRISGEPFDEYIDRHILTPLGMHDTTFDQPLPARLQPMMATGYLDASAGKTMPFEFVQVWPAGSVSSTAADMARFMMAHLQNGTLGSAHILNAQTAKLMHSRAFTLIPGLLNGFDYGFYQENRNGHQIIGHGGDTIVFHSDLHLILDQNTGIFMSFNSAGKAGAVEAVRTAVFRAFLDRYYPYTPPAEVTVRNPKIDAARVAGYYLSSRREETALRLLSRLDQAQVSARPDGTITVTELKTLSGAPIVWREVGPLDYVEENGQTHLRFATDANGNLFFATDDFIPVMVFQRVSGLQTQHAVMTLGGISIAIFILSILIWLGSWIFRRVYAIPLEMPLAFARLRLAARWGAIAFVVMILAWVNVLQSSASDPASLFNMDRPLAVLYTLGLIALVGTLAMIANAVVRLVRGPGGILSRLGDLLVGLAAVYGFYAIVAFELASFNFHY